MDLSGKLALVTGGAGFIGSHLTDRLLREGVRVRVLDNLSSGNPDNINLAEIELQRGDVRDEEAKAFAFSIAWMRKIKELNIGNLATAIKLSRPAENGLHNVALDFVMNKIEKGSNPLTLFADLSRRVENVSST